MQSRETDALSAIVRRMRLRAGIFAEARYCGAWGVDTSGSKAATFHIIQAGDCWVHWQNEVPRRLFPGDLVFFPRDDRHLIASCEDVPVSMAINAEPEDVPDQPGTKMLCGYFDFAGQVRWPLLDALPDIIILTQQERLAQGTQSLIDLIMVECAQCLPGREAALEQLSYLLLLQLLRGAMLDDHKQGLLCALDDAHIGKVLNAMHTQPGGDWNLESLADLAGMSRTSFNNRFNKLVGQSPMAYLSAWRMQVAVDELRNTDVPIAVLAEELGYGSEAAFRNAFTKLVGRPPGRVRREVEADLGGDRSATPA